MTLSQFLLRLRKFKGQFSVDSCDCLRGTLPDYPTRYVYPCCPITAMLWELKHETSFNACYLNSAQKIGLCSSDAQLIVNCADHVIHNLLDRISYQEYDKLVVRLTKVMLRVLGIELSTVKPTSTI